MQTQSLDMEARFIKWYTDKGSSGCKDDFQAHTALTASVHLHDRRYCIT